MIPNEQQFKELELEEQEALKSKFKYITRKDSKSKCAYCFSTFVTQGNLIKHWRTKACKRLEALRELNPEFHWDPQKNKEMLQQIKQEDQEKVGQIKQEKEEQQQ